MNKILTMVVAALVAVVCTAQPGERRGMGPRGGHGFGPRPQQQKVCTCEACGCAQKGAQQAPKFAARPMMRRGMGMGRGCQGRRPMMQRPCMGRCFQGMGPKFGPRPMRDCGFQNRDMGPKFGPGPKGDQPKFKKGPKGKKVQD